MFLTKKQTNTNYCSDLVSLADGTKVTSQGCREPVLRLGEIPRNQLQLLDGECRRPELLHERGLVFEEPAVLRSGLKIGLEDEAIEKADGRALVHLTSQLPEQVVANVLVVERPLQKELYQVREKVWLVFEGL